MSDEETKEAPEADVLRPGPDVEGEPYWCIMHEDRDGNVDGNVWSFGPRIMLFFDKDIATRLMTTFSKAGSTTYVLRGVTEAHLAKLQQVAEASELEVFVALKIHGRSIEAIPVEEHMAEAPPDLPPPPA